MVGFTGFLAGGAAQQSNVRRQQATADRGVDVQEDRLALFREEFLEKQKNAGLTRALSEVAKIDQDIRGLSAARGLPQFKGAGGAEKYNRTFGVLIQQMQALRAQKQTAINGGDQATAGLGGQASALIGQAGDVGATLAARAKEPFDIAGDERRAAAAVSLEGVKQKGRLELAKAGTGGDVRERRIERLMEGVRIGPDGEERPVTRNEAIGVIEGRLVVSRDDQGRVTIADKLPPIATAKATAKAGAAGTIPERADLPGATGGSGFFGTLANRAADFVGGKLPFKETGAGVEALNSLATNTIVGLAVELPGKPSNFMLKKFDELSVDPAALFQGDRRSLLRFKQMRNLVQSSAAKAKFVVDNPESFTPSQVTIAQQNLLETNTLLKDYNTVVDSFEKALSDPKKGVPLIKDRVVGKTERKIGRETFVWDVKKDGTFGWRLK